METSNKNNFSEKINSKEAQSVNLRILIKSPFIIKKIFSFLEESLKLNVVIYNRFYHNLFGIDIEYLEKVSGKYINGEKNGNVKVYKKNTKTILFEGEYKNGKRNGKGKEFYKNGTLLFEGEYLNGFRIKGIGYNYKGNKIIILEENGKGKECYKNGNLQFEGEYKYGRRWNGKGYNINGNYEFEIKNGKGRGKEYDYNNKLIFEGEYLNEKRWNGKRIK